ncbi:LysM peptidoglycan-binding domain-containing protein [Facklamia sp. P13064]|uniref:LysM peptidoglycan-binding domain-containing protein n=1 Tax=Facklamia sp. P13064 TaxID=3421953 RepID=UPI003D16CC96
MSQIPIREYIFTNNFNSKTLGLRRRSHDYPSPDPKGSNVSIQGQNGSLDFGMIGGEKFFEDRPISYEFVTVRMDKNKRKALEMTIKQQLVPYGRQPIYDTWFYGHYWFGECTKVKVKDDPRNRGTLVYIEFAVYPYLYSTFDYFPDIWDIFNFDTDVINYSFYYIDGVYEVDLYNRGGSSTIPLITVYSDELIEEGLDDSGESIRDTVLKEGELYTVKPGDILHRIANKFNVSLSELARWNNIRMDSQIYAGQVLQVSAPQLVSASGNLITTNPVYMQIEYYGDVINLEKGANKNTSLVLRQGLNHLKIKGKGVIGFQYRAEVMG